MQQLLFTRCAIQCCIRRAGQLAERRTPFLQLQIHSLNNVLEFAKHTWVWALAPASKLAAAARATNWLISKGSGASGTAQRSRGANVMRNKAYVHVLEVGYTLTGLENCNCSGTMAATSIYSSQEARQCVDVVYQGPRNRLPAACHYALDASMAIFSRCKLASRDHYRLHGSSPSTTAAGSPPAIYEHVCAWNRLRVLVLLSLIHI